MKLFISYARSDNQDESHKKRWLDRLVKYLEPLRGQGVVEVWYDDKIDVGEVWNKEILHQIETSDVFILMVSPSFLASSYIRTKEMPHILVRWSAGMAKIIPIYIGTVAAESCLFQFTNPDNGVSEFSINDIQAINPTETLNRIDEGAQDIVFAKLVKEVVRAAADMTHTLSQIKTGDQLCPMSEKSGKGGFLKLLAAFGCSAVAASSLVNALPLFDIFTKNKKYSRSNRAINLLFKSFVDIKFHYGGSHYIVKGIHSDNAVTGSNILDCISSILSITEEKDISIFELDQNSDWVTIGAPSSNFIASEILGYNSSDISKHIFIPGNLRFIYEYENELVKLKRYTASGHIQEEAKRSKIKDLTNNRTFMPDEGDWLEEDYLLITRMKDNKSGKYRTIIGGTHGIGTRGFDAILAQNPFSISETKRIESSPSGCFQVLVRVKTILNETKMVPNDIIIEKIHTW